MNHQKTQLNMEVKVSLGSINNETFGFSQLRLAHKVDLYILVAYYINTSNIPDLGEVFIFKLNKSELISFVGKGYSHGTKSS